MAQVSLRRSKRTEWDRFVDDIRDSISDAIAEINAEFESEIECQEMFGQPATPFGQYTISMPLAFDNFESLTELVRGLEQRLRTQCQLQFTTYIIHDTSRSFHILHVDGGALMEGKGVVETKEPKTSKLTLLFEYLGLAIENRGNLIVLLGFLTFFYKVLW